MVFDVADSIAVGAGRDRGSSTGANFAHRAGQPCVMGAVFAAVMLYQELGFRAFGLERGCLLADGVLHDEITDGAPARRRPSGRRASRAHPVMSGT